MPKTIKMTFEEKQILLEALRRYVIILYPECEQRKTASELEKRPRPYGPMAQPSARKPSTGVTLSAFESGTTRTDAARKVKMSLPRASRLIVFSAALMVVVSCSAMLGASKSCTLRERPTPLSVGRCAAGYRCRSPCIAGRCESQRIGSSFVASALACIK